MKLAFASVCPARIVGVFLSENALQVLVGDTEPLRACSVKKQDAAPSRFHHTTCGSRRQRPRAWRVRAAVTQALSSAIHFVAKRAVVGDEGHRAETPCPRIFVEGEDYGAAGVEFAASIVAADVVRAAQTASQCRGRVDFEKKRGRARGARAGGYRRRVPRGVRRSSDTVGRLQCHPRTSRRRHRLRSRAQARLVSRSTPEPSGPGWWLRRCRLLLPSRSAATRCRRHQLGRYSRFPSRGRRRLAPEAQMRSLERRLEGTPGRADIEWSRETPKFHIRAPPRRPMRRSERSISASCAKS